MVSRRFSLTKCLDSLCKKSEIYKKNPYVRPLIEEYYKKIKSIKLEYDSSKKTINTIKRVKSRKKYAEKLFVQVEKLGAIIPKYMDALKKIPPKATKDELEKWIEKNKREYDKLVQQVQAVNQDKKTADKRLYVCFKIEKPLDEIAADLADLTQDRKLERLAKQPITRTYVGDRDVNNMEIGSPTPKR